MRGLVPWCAPLDDVIYDVTDDETDVTNHVIVTKIYIIILSIFFANVRIIKNNYDASMILFK